MEDPRVRYLPVRAVGWVADEPQPGLVEVRFTDAHGTPRVLVDKCAVFDVNLDRDTVYPVALELPVEVVEQRSTDETEVSVIRLPWGLSAEPIEVRSSDLVDRA